MSDVISPFDAAPSDAALAGPALAGPALAGPALAGPALVGSALVGSALAGSGLAGLHRLRVDGGVDLTFVTRDASGMDGGSITYAVRVHEADGHRIRFPAPERTSDASGEIEAVLLNTGGGLAGGDKVRLAATCGGAARATISSVAAERVYRSAGAPTRMDLDLHLGAGSRLAWLPQETILYAGAHLRRRVTADLADDAVLTVLDIVVFGRRGAAERMTSGTLTDRWMVWRDGRLAHAEAVHLDGDIEALMARPAMGAGGHVVATLLHLAPNAGDRLDAVRAVLSACAGLDVTAVASAWDGKLVVRALGSRSDHVRQAMRAAAAVLTSRPPSRVWRN